MQDVFDTYIENSFGEFKQAEFKFHQFDYNYQRLFPPSLESNVLDIGIGRGEMLSCMKKWGYENYAGIDISPSTVKYCQSLGLNCHQIENTVSWLKQQHSKFDLITLLDVLEHFKKDDVIPLLKALHYALKPGAKVIIQVPNLQSPDGQLHRYNDFTHEIGFVEHSLQQVLLVAGFQDFEFRGFEQVFVLKPLNLKKVILYFFRTLYWKYVRFVRRISQNLNPEILHPVFYVVATKRSEALLKHQNQST